MTRTIIAMDVADMSAFAKSLREQIFAINHKPSHVEMLNLLSKAAGFRNFQHLRASRAAMPVPAGQPLAAPDAAEPVADEARVGKMLRLFDREGRVVRWPRKRSQQELCLWYLWSKIPARTFYSEREIGTLLEQWHRFGDPALLRRDLFDLGLVRRNRDGSDYCRIERRPPPELRLLSGRVADRMAVAA